METPLEMQGMIRRCHPIIPHVGLFRMSCDHEVTLRNHRAAEKERDIVSLSYRLKQMTRNCSRFRLCRRLLITALDPLYPDIILQILQFLKEDRPPELYTPFLAVYIGYLDTVSVNTRMKQFAGRLSALGYTTMTLPIPDYEYEGYKMLEEKTRNHYNMVYYDPDANCVDQIYQSVQDTDKWPVLSSRIYSTYRCLAWNKDEWLYHCARERLTLYVNACIRVNALNDEEIQLLTYWTSRMKYASTYT
jgi:hypothetical protein